MENKFCLDLVTNDFLVDFISKSISFDTFHVTREEVQSILNGEIGEIDTKAVTLVNNYYNGFVYTVSLVKREEPLQENDLKDIHDKVVNGLSQGGLYRNVDISIKGSNHTPPSYLKVYDRMKKYFDTINNDKNEMYYNIAFSHLQLMKIHPFLDGNGRVARIILNYELLRYGLKPVIISSIDKEQYFNLLEEFKVNKNIEPFIACLKEMQK